MGDTQSTQSRLEGMERGSVVELETPKEAVTGTVDHDGPHVSLDPLNGGVVERYDISGDQVWEVSWPEDGVESDERSLGLVQSMEVIEGGERE